MIQNFYMQITLADISIWKEMNFTAMKYFVKKYPRILLKKDDELQFDRTDSLEAEFLNF